MLDDYNKLAEGAGKVLETVPQLYDDALKPAVQETGRFLERIPRAINAAFSDLDKWILNKEYSIEETKKLLEYKLQNISPDKIVTPEPYVAIPALQAITYSMNSEELRELYANLLAKSMNIDTKNFVHPSFVEIIKQLSPEDAQVLNKISTDDYLSVATLSASKYVSEPTSTRQEFYIDPIEPPTTQYKIPYITSIRFLDYETVLLCIDNLSRLGLIEIRFTLGNSIDSDILSSTNYIQFKSKLKSYMDNTKWRYEENGNIFSLTSLGRTFKDICITSKINQIERGVII